MLVSKPARDFGEGRREAVAQTRRVIAGNLLRHFERLVAHPGASGITDTHYQDFDLGGAICCTAMEAELLFHLVSWARAKRVLEIGAYVGWSTAHLLQSGAEVWCVDPMTEIGDGVTGNPDAVFRGNLGRAGLAERVHLQLEASPQALNNMSGWRFDLAFVDGGHTDGQPGRDVKAVASLMWGDGLIVLHDMWLREVREAAKWLIAQGCKAYTFNTANYLTVFFREEPGWWKWFWPWASGEFALVDATEQRAEKLKGL